MRAYIISAWIVFLKDWTTMSKSSPWEVVISEMIHWKNGPSNCNAEVTLSNAVIILIQAILSSVLKY